MWASITFTLYAALYITLILFQLNVERNYWYNKAMTTVISSLTYFDNQEPRTITDVENYDDLYNWLNQSFPSMAT